ncbi:MAG TPA: hypothetical protein VLQ91_13670 [Draconibacterium sp.]|jgi:hypothetical protein|nr:hypothetical protein [Draconibacterium sp.]
MKRILSVTLLSGGAVFLLSSFILIGDYPQDPPRSKKTEKHIKMVKIDDDGKKMELDTVIHGDDIFVWQGDTIGGKKEMKWISKDDFKMDSIHQNFDMNFEYKIEDDGEGNMVIMKSGKGGKHMIMAPVPPGTPMPPHAPNVMMFRGPKSKNVIDLSDPGIISYDKKLRKDGTEKITIVRKQVSEEDSLMEDVLIRAPHPGNAFFYSDSPEHVKTIKVIKSDDGTTRVFEDDKVMHLEGDKGEATFTGEDGEVIHIKEINEGDKKQIKVEVEKKVEKENK